MTGDRLRPISSAPDPVPVVLERVPVGTPATMLAAIDDVSTVREREPRTRRDSWGSNAPRAPFQRFAKCWSGGTLG